MTHTHKIQHLTGYKTVDKTYFTSCSPLSCLDDKKMEILFGVEALFLQMFFCRSWRQLNDHTAYVKVENKGRQLALFKKVYRGKHNLI